MRVVHFFHGKESGPWGEKIQRLAEVAKQKDFAVESRDFTSTHDPDQRVEMMRDLANQKFDLLVLVGSSLGGYVATVASQFLSPQGLFLMAPAFYFPQFKNSDPQPKADQTLIIHGWNDEIIPVDQSIRFARQHQAELVLLDGDHRLIEPLPLITAIFGMFLDRLIEKRQ